MGDVAFFGASVAPDFCNPVAKKEHRRCARCCCGPFSPARKPVGFVEDRQGYRRGTVNMQIQGGGLSVVKPVLTDQQAIVVKDQPMTDSMAHADFFRR